MFSFTWCTPHKQGPSYIRKVDIVCRILQLQVTATYVRLTNDRIIATANLLNWSGLLLVPADWSVGVGGSCVVVGVGVGVGVDVGVGVGVSVRRLLTVEVATPEEDILSATASGSEYIHQI